MRTSSRVLSRTSFPALIQRRCFEAASELALGDAMLRRLSWKYGWHPHFREARGFGVTYLLDGPACEFVFARKICGQSPARMDGITRHEIGHAVDHLTPRKKLDEWAYLRGYALPHTPERRADAIAEALWQEPLYYDGQLCVQTTSPSAHRLRPVHLGL